MWVVGTCGSVQFGEEPGGIDRHNFDYSQIAEKADALADFTIASSSIWTWRRWRRRPQWGRPSAVRAEALGLDGDWRRLRVHSLCVTGDSPSRSPHRRRTMEGE